MRQATMAMLLLSVVASTMRCSEDESLAKLDGRAVVASAPIHWAYFFPEGDSLTVDTDTLRWLYEFPSGGPSSLSIIVSAQDTGRFPLDLAVETYTDSVPGTVFLDRDYRGEFTDTVLLVASDVSGVIVPPQNSRLFVRNGGEILDSIPLVNPW